MVWRIVLDSKPLFGVSFLYRYGQHWPTTYPSLTSLGFYPNLGELSAFFCRVSNEKRWLKTRKPSKTVAMMLQERILIVSLRPRNSKNSNAPILWIFYGLFHSNPSDQLSRITSSWVGPTSWRDPMLNQRGCVGGTSCWGKEFRFHGIYLDLLIFHYDLRKNAEYD